jgi:hypothetical protein
MSLFGSLVSLVLLLVFSGGGVSQSLSLWPKEEGEEVF